MHGPEFIDLLHAGGGGGGLADGAGFLPPLHPPLLRLRLRTFLQPSLLRPRSW
jgi:hypothetical protein